MSNLKTSNQHIPTESLDQPFGGQRTNCLVVAYGVTVRATEREPHFQIVLARARVRRPIHVEAVFRGNRAMDVVPDFADIIFVLDRGLVKELVSCCDATEKVSRCVLCAIELVGFHFVFSHISHNFVY